MATSDERREVAERLRRDAAIGDELRAKGLSMTIDLTEASSYLQDIAMLTGVSSGGTVEWTEFERRLADLIDPTCHAVVEDETQVCSECGGDLDERYGWNYCPECGCRVTGGESDE